MLKNYLTPISGTAVCLLSTFFIVSSHADPEPVPEPLPMKQCTHQTGPCLIVYSAFGTCCLSAQGLGRTRPAQQGESKTALETADPCGAEFDFFIYPCARANGNYCGGTYPDFDCNYVNP
jgi:hypothetical protein